MQTLYSAPPKVNQNPKQPLNLFEIKQTFSLLDKLHNAHLSDMQDTLSMEDFQNNMRNMLTVEIYKCMTNKLNNNNVFGKEARVSRD